MPPKRKLVSSPPSDLTFNERYQGKSFLVSVAYQDAPSDMHVIPVTARSEKEWKALFDEMSRPGINYDTCTSSGPRELKYLALQLGVNQFNPHEDPPEWKDQRATLAFTNRNDPAILHENLFGCIFTHTYSFPSWWRK